jgi:hypothetical protein
MARLYRRRGTLLEAIGRAGSDGWPSCIICGENDIRCLEAHHVAGRSVDDTQAIICRNCHAKLSDTQRDHPTVPMARKLSGLADLLRLIARELDQ